MNGTLSLSAPEVRHSPRLIRQNHISRVQLRPRPKPNPRPMSMPPEQLLNARNSASDLAVVKGHDPAIEEVSEEEKPKGRAANHYRNTYIDTHTLRRTWDKQYKHYNITPRTAMIVAKLPGEAEITRVTLSSTSTPLCNSTSTNKTDVVDYSRVQNAFRPPRTLQPPPGTFYKPPGIRDKTLALDKTLTNKTPMQEETLEDKSAARKEDVTNANSIEDEEDDEDNDVEEGVVEEEFGGLEVSVDEDPAQDPQLSQIQTKPVYPRLRARHMQDFENREAHFV